VEKIRTIGDNYMAACGVPRPMSDHSGRLARMALEMKGYIDSRPPFEGNRIHFRIGINSGPVVAGIVGLQKFHYDVWGDAVNLASRMESHGMPGKIQIARNTYELIRESFAAGAEGRLLLKGREYWKPGFWKEHADGGYSVFCERIAGQFRRICKVYCNILFF
jgi:adenylate cyclase